MPVTNLVTGRFLSSGDGLLELFEVLTEDRPLGTTLRCSLFLLISPCGVSTM